MTPSIEKKEKVFFFGFFFSGFGYATKTSCHCDLWGLTLQISCVTELRSGISGVLGS